LKHHAQKSLDAFIWQHHTEGGAIVLVAMILRTTDDLARQVRARRYELGLTQEELANLANLHRTYISLFEQGKRSIRFDSALRILHTLGMDLEVRARGK
jgi:DNA-binding XRE family transcriptional regulator